MANGTVIKAYQVQAGDEVMSYNLVAHKLQPSTVSYVKTFYASNKYTFNGNLQVDGLEIMYINGKWQRAYAAKVGDTLFDPLNGSNVTIRSIHVNDTGGIVYDFIGSPVNNYIANGFLIDKDSTSEPGCPSSVAGSSLITLANMDIVPVSSLKNGTVVLGYNVKTGTPVPTVVVGIKHRYANSVYVINGQLITDGRASITANGKQMLISDLKVGDMLTGPLGRQIPVSSIHIVNNTNVSIYDINTAPTDAYVIDGYVVS